MAQRRFHYEQAFEHYLRANRVPYVAVDEARKALLPRDSGGGEAALKSFDFVVYAPGRNLLVDVKGRMFGSAAPASGPGKFSAKLGGSVMRSTGRSSARSSRRSSSGSGAGGARFESWVTREDVEDMARWQELFGEGFEAVFVFTYCLRRQPPDALFEEVFMFGGRWYALREITLGHYRREMVERSARWRTVHLPKAAAARVSRPFSVRQAAPSTPYCSVQKASLC